jgi:hypothetical protein
LDNRQRFILQKIMNLEINDLKVYVPAENFELSKRFYTELGFELTEAWGGSFDCKFGNAQFRLQNYYQHQWADNFMMRFDVKDANSWYSHGKKIIESEKYGSAKISEPEQIGDSTIVHIWDPSGVLLIFIQ